LCFGAPSLWAAKKSPTIPGLISPGCRKSKVRVAKVYLGQPKAHWPTPKMDLGAEQQRYEAQFAGMQREFADVDFVVNDIISTKEQLAGIQAVLKNVDGILAIHLSMGHWNAC
jgi:hypothetical protein